MMFLVIFGSLADGDGDRVAGEPGDGGLATSRSTGLLSAAETGMQYLVFRVNDGGAARCETRDGLIDETNAPDLWDARCGNGMLDGRCTGTRISTGGHEPFETGTTLNLGPIASVGAGRAVV